MTIGLMPVTGIPLPFISYGGSNLLTNMIAVGIVENVWMRRPEKSRQQNKNRRIYMHPLRIYIFRGGVLLWL